MSDSNRAGNSGNAAMIPDSRLHAFVDGQLGVREAGDILCEAARSPELAAQIDSLQQLKQLVRHAYREAVPVTDNTAGHNPVAPLRRFPS